MRNFFRHLKRDQQGAMVIETAIVAPVLVLMALGAFQVSQLVARQLELESAATEAAAIALAAPPEDAAKRTILTNVIKASTGLETSRVVVTEAFRCGGNSSYITDSSTCTTGVLSKYVKIQLTDTYAPVWTQFGFGSDVDYDVVRYVMYKQQQV
ncbi:MAG: pilus assembly protein [Novosphingobium sp.]|jgi:Flp pilus assembly protein TadG|nr:pilus assembly protein [Novosphingobium sp.]MBP6555146.1 pilus assembly protein [Novosphingobium sp.]